MLNDMTRIRSGNMPLPLQAKVDSLLDEFMVVVDALSKDRHLQTGIARSQMPSSMVVILDKENLSILAQFQPENRFATYFMNIGITLTPQQAANSAQWEFGFEDPFIIQFPGRLLEQGMQQRHSALEKIASEHIDSEFKRFVGLLSLIRTRPIFGPAPPGLSSRSALLLLPNAKEPSKNHGTILKAVEAIGLFTEEMGDIRNGKSIVREMWMTINQMEVIIADLTGPDPGVMYGLGIAHTIGKNTILIYPKGSKYLTDIPNTLKIEYEDSDMGRARLEKQLSEMLSSTQQQIAAN